MHQEFLPPGIVILTGAGISKESGIDTFRDKDGLWTKVNLEEVATIEAWYRDKKKVLDFYNAGRRVRRPQHHRQRRARRTRHGCEREYPGEVTVVTQNIDLLHEAGGAGNVLHMHGRMGEIRCMACGAVTASDADLTPETVCPTAGAVGELRPHVVWFGEMPFHMDEIYAALDALRPVPRRSAPRAGLSGRRLRAARPPQARQGAHGRAQPRADRRPLAVPRTPLRARHRDRAGLCRAHSGERLDNKEKIDAGHDRRHGQPPATSRTARTTSRPTSHGRNFYAIDRQFQDLLSLYLEPGLLRQMTPHFERLGALAGNRLDDLAFTADRHPPVLQPRDRFGRDEDWIEYHPCLSRDGEDGLRGVRHARHEPSRRRAGPRRARPSAGQVRHHLSLRAGRVRPDVPGLGVGHLELHHQALRLARR